MTQKIKLNKKNIGSFYKEIDKINKQQSQFNQKTNRLKKDELQKLNELNLYTKDQIIGPIHKKLTKKLIDDGFIQSFSKIKKYDRIEVGKDIYELLSIIENAQIDDSNFYLLIPFINTGVIKLHLLKETLYINFTVKEVNMNEKTVIVYLDTYKYSCGYYSKLFDLTYKISYNKSGTHDIFYQDFKYESNYIFDNYDLDKILTSDERKNFVIFQETHEFNVSNIEEFSERILFYINLFNNCIQAINNYIEMNKSKGKSRYNKKNKTNESEVINDVIDTTNTEVYHKKNEIIIGGIKFKKGENSQIKIRNGNILRRTEVWGVVGHLRHYKNGKVVYIEPYIKGPARLDKEPEQKIYKVKAIYKEENHYDD